MHVRQDRWVTEEGNCGPTSPNEAIFPPYRLPFTNLKAKIFVVEWLWNLFSSHAPCTKNQGHSAFFPSHASVASARSLHKMLLVVNELVHAQHHESEKEVHGHWTNARNICHLPFEPKLLCFRRVCMARSTWAVRSLSSSQDWVTVVG